MSYLQLADNGPSIDPASVYVRVPAPLSNTGETQYIREDFFDDLDNPTYNFVMGALDDYQLSENHGDHIFLQDKAERQARRKARKDRKARRTEARTSKRESEAIYKSKQAAGEAGYEKGKGLKAVMDTVGNIFGGEGDITKAGQSQLTYDIDWEAGKGITASADATGDTAQWIRGIPNWAVIGGGVLLVGGTIFLITKGGKKK